MDALITPAQNRKLHFLLSRQPGLMDSKREFISNFTDGRTDSARRLTRREAAKIINALQVEDPCGKMIRKIYAICYSMEWIFDHEGDENEKRMNRAVIDGFLKKRGIYKKALQDYTCNELPLLVSQFESIERHSKESAERQEISKEIDAILDELGIKYGK